MASQIDYVLFDSPLGYFIFEVTHQIDNVALQTEDYQQASADAKRFGKMVKLTGFTPFR
jgi:nucleolar protein 56